MHITNLQQAKPKQHPTARHRLSYANPATVKLHCSWKKRHISTKFPKNKMPFLAQSLQRRVVLSLLVQTTPDVQARYASSPEFPGLKTLTARAFLKFRGKKDAFEICEGRWINEKQVAERFGVSAFVTRDDTGKMLLEMQHSLH